MEVAGLFIGAGIGTVFTALYEGVKTLAARPTKFKAQLEALELTLGSFDLEVIRQMGWHNEAMGLPNEDVKALEEELNKGVRIIGELLNASLWNRIDSRYISKLVQLNRSLNILERRLKLQSMRDVKETRHMMQILLIRLTLHQETPSRDAYTSLLLSNTRLLDTAPQEAHDRIQTLDSLRNIASSSTDLQQFHGHGEIQGNFPTSSLQLDIAPQEALHQILTLDPMRNIASTSTDLQQFHGHGEIQEIGSSSGHLPSRPENSNFYRDSANQQQIYGVQIETVSATFKVEFRSEKCKSRAIRLVASIDGVMTVSLVNGKDNLVVTGTEIDVVRLFSGLRKHSFAEIVSVYVGPVKRQEEPASVPIRRTGEKQNKISKWFKPASVPIRRTGEKQNKISKWFKPAYYNLLKLKRS